MDKIVAFYSARNSKKKSQQKQNRITILAAVWEQVQGAFDLPSFSEGKAKIERRILFYS